MSPMEVVVSADDSRHFSGRALGAEMPTYASRSPPSASSWPGSSPAVRQKSERRLVDNPDQLGLEALLGDRRRPPPGCPHQEIPTPPRAKARDAAASPTKACALARRPVEVIGCRRHSSRSDAEQYTINRSQGHSPPAQRPAATCAGVRARWSSTGNCTLSEVPRARGCSEQPADVSVLAGCWSTNSPITCPCTASTSAWRRRITLSRTTLTSYVQRAIDLLPPSPRPARHILSSKCWRWTRRPIKAGRDAAS